MKKILKYLENNFLASLLIYIIFYALSSAILEIFDLNYRVIIGWFSAAIIIIGLFVGRIEKQVLEVPSTKKTYILVIGFSLIITFFVNHFLIKECVIERNGKKYIAYVDTRWTTKVDYYEYKGPIVISTQKAIREDYGEIYGDPIKEKGYEPIEIVYYDAKGNVLKTEKNEVPKVNSKNFGITTSPEYLEIEIKDSKYYASMQGANFGEIISPEEAADIADEEAKNEKYQYQPWKSEFYSRGKQKQDYVDAKLCCGLDEIDRLYYWEEEWRTHEYFRSSLMWQIRLFDENDPLTSLYIYVNAETGEVEGAGKSSD